VELTFRAVDVGDGRDGRWLEAAEPVWPNIAAETEPCVFEPAGEAAARELFAAHMPELVPVLDGLAAELDRPGAAGVLTQAALKPFFSGCSMASAPGALVRNYDFDPEHCERTVVASRFLRPVIGMGDFLWGLLDGVNDAGLAVSLTFGGRRDVGDGFGIPIVLRYLLETCETVDEARAALERIPVHAAQNVTLLDRSGAFLTAYVGPGRPPEFHAVPATTNHQGRVEWPEYARAIRTVERERCVLGLLDDPRLTSDQFIAAFLQEPLHNTDYMRGFGTIYTAAYFPGEGRAEYRWPGFAWPQSFAAFLEGEHTETFVEASRAA
jgi:predicted choloylglycine hydrolase